VTTYRPIDVIAWVFLLAICAAVVLLPFNPKFGRINSLTLKAMIIFGVAGIKLLHSFFSKDG